MNLVFVHGWSVSDTETYGQLPEALALKAPEQLNLNIRHIYLGKYISFHDEVTVDDIARAFEYARKEVLGENTPFSCITHSTGGPVMRTWIERFYGAKNLGRLPLEHLIMLAPANHGSALAQLGKSRISRIKTWFQGVEPGQGVLNWLELGSIVQRELNLAWLDYRMASNNFFPVVITGDTIDKKLYDYLNAYTGEKGSDGVIRAAAANLNYRYIRLKQSATDQKISVHNAGHNQDVYPLEIDDVIKKPHRPCAFEIVANACHTGKSKGIMLSVTKRNADKKPVIRSILDSLQVKTGSDYTTLTQHMRERTLFNQKRHRYTMVVIHVRDDRGHDISDYDFFLLAGPDYSPDKLPKGFFVDHQKNKINNCLVTLYLDCTVLKNIPEEKIGFRVIARPEEGFVHYSPGEFRSANIPLSDLLMENETLLLDIILKRRVDVNTFRLDPLESGRTNFKDEKPINIEVT